MRSFVVLFLVCLTGAWLPIACVDAYEPTVDATLNVVVVDGTINNLAEPQTVRLSRANADPLTGRFSTIPIEKARVEVVVDSTTVIVFRETVAGRYQAPNGFVGQIGRSYQLRFTLDDGLTQYESDQQRMPPVPPIAEIRAQFNARSLSPAQQLQGGYAAAHDFYVDVDDPANQTNYYRWDWIDWERQEWCRSCQGGLYFVNDGVGNPLEACVAIDARFPFTYDYNCRTTCWEIIYSNSLTLFADTFNQGNTIRNLRVAQVPLYSKERCLVELRQTSLTAGAYLYFKQLDEQTQRTGGLADTPPVAPIGNVSNKADRADYVVGYFTASAVSRRRYALTRKDATGFAPGLFQALNGGRNPVNEQSLVRDRPPLAVCVPGENRTPVKPEGWPD